MGNYEQLIRIALYTVGGFVLGDGIANSAEYQAAVGGLIHVVTFAWWLYRNRRAA
ncbi:Pam3-gp28 family putative phage holin [Shinella pollutisoli]|uniref:Uncharacterized protein n=1 Tax=Shinella pollutisoli TaxID=2250594 RepID=A0ABV7DIJ2_9HYPH|nr:hypothetical protein [Shinella pollutisoli]